MILRERSSCLKVLIALGERNRSNKIHLRRLDVVDSNLNKAIKKLIEIGLAQREKTNHRGYDYFLTKKGIHIRDLIMPIAEFEGINVSKYHRK